MSIFDSYQRATNDSSCGSTEPGKHQNETINIFQANRLLETNKWPNNAHESLKFRGLGRIDRGALPSRHSSREASWL